MADRLLSALGVGVRRWREVRTGEYAPEVYALGSATVPVRNTAGVVSVPASTWTTLATRTVPTGTEEEIVWLQGDIAALLGTRYRVRLQIAATTVFEEVVHTDQLSVMSPAGIRATAGQVVNWQIFHAEATAQNCQGLMITRPV